MYSVVLSDRSIFAENSCVTRDRAYQQCKVLTHHNKVVATDGRTAMTLTLIA